MKATKQMSRKKVVLSIEPDYMMQVYIRKKLKRHGLLVNLAANCSEALDFLYSNVPLDMIILDVSGNSRDTIVFLRQIKLHKNYSDIKIYITGCKDVSKFMSQISKDKIETTMITGVLEDLMNVDQVIEEFLSGADVTEPSLK